LIESEVISGAKPSRMLGRFRIGAPTVRAWTVTIREEVRLEGMVDNNLLLESVNNIRVFLSSVFRTDHFLDGRRRSMGYPDLLPFTL